MKLRKNIIIAQKKLTEYLLVVKKRNDKSQWLAKAGYILENWKKLEKDLREQILSIDAMPTESTEYGQTYEIRGKLFGTNGKSIAVCTIWMKESATKETKFITMYPDKRE
ncbi:MAG: hypothetical protein J7K32_04650 [Deltaproteobacteria bacterium]|nr:hypothetical protein [Deltaproteobacteria bacterium]